ncbi:MAG: hypothetical protein AAF547_24565, partial [Actinomycetota bacterium]
ATALAGATSYCWAAVSFGRTFQNCSADPVEEIPGGAAGVNPGELTITAEARNAAGEVIETETIRVAFYARTLLRTPLPGERFDRGELIRVRFNDIPTGTDYCATLRQGGVDRDTRCDGDATVTFRTAGLAEGSATISAEVRRGTDVIGRQTILVEIER